jgi:hypothetical protein
MSEKLVTSPAKIIQILHIPSTNEIGMHPIRDSLAFGIVRTIREKEGQVHWISAPTEWKRKIDMKVENQFRNWSRM